MILADKIIENRKKNGWSQEELAEMLGVSRQSVSKWEGAQSVPDMNRILKLSEVFGVSTDELLKDDLELPAERPVETVILETRRATDIPEVRNVSMEEAVSFLDFRNNHANRVSIGVMVCILSPVTLILLSGAQEAGLLALSENQAAGIGLVVLLLMVAAAVAVFVLEGIRGSGFEYFEKEVIETAYGVDGMAREQQRNVLPWQPAVAVVHGGLWHDRGVYFGRHVCQRARNGDEERYDLFADVPGIHSGLFRSGFRAAAGILPLQPDDDLQLLARAAGHPIV
jgi:transcriptional regulator with XRE-family HTH domain